MLRPYNLQTESKVKRERRRQSIRLPGYDYRTPASYFVTICTTNREPLLERSNFRYVLEACWRAIPDHFPHAGIDAFVVMPNHVHGVIVLKAEPTGRRRPDELGSRPVLVPRLVEPGSLSAIVRSLKSVTTREINAIRDSKGAAVWQRNYYERIIRDDRELDRIRNYIANNPANWRFDLENPNRDVAAEYLKAWSWIEAW